MIFDSKRHQASEAEADTATLAEAPDRAARVAPADVRAMPPAGANRMDRAVYPEEDDPVVAQPAADVRAENRRSDGEALEPLFTPEVAENFRRDWDAVQIGFVDDPRQAVRKADELVQQVLHNLTDHFSGERNRVEAQGAQADSTEALRMALRRDRAFLERLLSL
jgi:hypothetical protein